MRGELVGLTLENIRGFEGKHPIALDKKLTTIIGPNNIGKSTILSAPRILVNQWIGDSNRKNYLGEYKRIGVINNSSALSMIIKFPLEVTEQDELTSGLKRHSIAVGVHLEGQPPSSHSNPLRELYEVPRRLGYLKVEIGLSYGKTNPQYLTVILDDVTDYESRFQRIGILNDDETLESTKPDLVFHFSKGKAEVSQWLAEYVKKYLRLSPFAAWAHRPIGKDDVWGQPVRRICDDEEENVRQALTFLKMLHTESGFNPLKEAITRHLPEFKKVGFIDKGQYEYRPSLSIGIDGSERNLTKDVLGSGSWTFLSILAAARVAHVTGASTLFLDEPHLYLHPGLERRLIRELLESSQWEGRPLQLVVATHSPAFVDAALRDGSLQVMEWRDKSRNSVSVYPLSRDKGAWRSTHFSSELFYAEKVIFVEGPSDVEAIRCLLDKVNPHNLSYHIQPIYIKDLILKERNIHVLTIVARSRFGSVGARPLLVLDNDAQAYWDREAHKLGTGLDPKLHMDVVFLGKADNDFESCFCENDFLVAYFQAQPYQKDGVSIDSIVKTALALPENQRPKRKEHKGSQVILRLYDDIVSEHDDRNKETRLTGLVAFLIEHWNAAMSEPVRTNLSELIKRLVSEDSQTLTTTTDTRGPDRH